MSAGPRILIVGAAGQVGTELCRSFAGCGEIVPCRRGDLDLADQDRVRSFIRGVAPDIILNAAAYTAVDKAESEPALAVAINAHAPRIMAEEALGRNALLVHYSTDYVFDGSKPAPWTEADKPNPLNSYGASKLAGEEALREVGGRYLIFRTSWIYGPHGHNFLLTMLRLARERDRLTIVDDQIGAPTTSIELANATQAIVDGILAGQFGEPETWAGLYHMTCGGAVSWFGFARAIFACAQAMLKIKTPGVFPIGTDDYPTPARRPKNSVLACEKLFARFGIRLASWQAALDTAIRELAACRTSV